tara:strand:+ start:245 stop:832 length:588 start_codon:yes stop_codon:yes gene_type:complete
MKAQMNALKNPLILERVKFYYQGNTTWINAKKQIDNGYRHRDYKYKSELEPGDIFKWYSSTKKITIRMVTKVTEKTISSKEVVSDNCLIKGWPLEEEFTFTKYQIISLKKYDTRFLKGRTLTFKRFNEGQIPVYDKNIPVLDYDILDETIDEHNLEYLVHGVPDDIQKKIDEENKLYQQMIELEEKVKMLKKQKK